MRQLGRGVVAFAVVVVLAAPMQARQWGEDQPGLGWFFRAKERIVKVIRTTVRTFGDGLSDPKP